VRKTAAKIEVRGNKTILIARTWGGWIEDEVSPLRREEAYRGINPRAADMQLVEKRR